ncbi:MAG: hypothetical protein OEW48_20955, partial [Phycisphaerae bacterium]|nr:hypothetical protein [Phycisphaerae bacterium]
RAQFWKEKDSEIRIKILGALEATTYDIDEIKDFSELVIKKESDAQVVKFAEETIANMDDLKKAIEASRKAKNTNRKEYRRQYEMLTESYGKEGDYEKLGSTSVLSDEPELKLLRERILRRDSDESFYDYQAVSKIIMMNRFSNSK